MKKQSLETIEEPIGDQNNPCPFLRVLAKEQSINPDCEPIWSLADKVTTVMTDDPEKAPAKFKIVIIALIASAGSLASLFRALTKGVKVNDLRFGPLDKLGGGSRVINDVGEVDEEQLARLTEFASEYLDEEGNLELGLDAKALEVMMDENFTRPTKRRRKIDRGLMNGEWPALLQVIGKTHLERPYLSLKEVNEMVRERKLPERILSRLS